MTYPCGEYGRTINTADNSSDNDISDSEHLSYVPFKRQAMTNYDSGNIDDLFLLRASPSSPSTFDADGNYVSETYGEWGIRPLHTSMMHFLPLCSRLSSTSMVILQRYLS